MKNIISITITLALFIIAANKSMAQKYENNRYGLALEKKGNNYVLKDAATIERLGIFDIEKAPADMFVPYKHKMKKLRPEDFKRCTTLHYIFKEYPNHKLVIEVDLPTNKTEKFPYMIWIHGGGWHGGDYLGHKGISTYLASHGIAGIRVSYSFPSSPASGALSSGRSISQSFLNEKSASTAPTMITTPANRPRGTVLVGR